MPFDTCSIMLWTRQTKGTCRLLIYSRAQLTPKRLTPHPFMRCRGVPQKPPSPTFRTTECGRQDEFWGTCCDCCHDSRSQFLPRTPVFLESVGCFSHSATEIESTTMDVNSLAKIRRQQWHSRCREPRIRSAQRLHGFSLRRRRRSCR